MALVEYLSVYFYLTGLHSCSERWLDGCLAILRPLDSISDIAGRLVCDSERSCAVAPRLRLKRSPPHVSSENEHAPPPPSSPPLPPPPKFSLPVFNHRTWSNRSSFIPKIVSEFLQTYIKGKVTLQAPTLKHN